MPCEVADLVAERLKLVVAVAEDDPIGRPRQAIPRLLPAHLQRAALALNVDEAIPLLVYTPREINCPHRAVAVVDEDLHGVFDGDRLDAAAFHGMEIDQLAEEVAREVEGVRAVVDEDAAAADGRVAVPPFRHVHAGREGVLEHDDRAEGAGFENLLGANDVLRVAELRGHRQHAALGVGDRDHAAGALAADGEWLLAKDVLAEAEEVRGDLLVRIRGRTHDHGIEVRPFHHGGVAVDPIVFWGSVGDGVDCRDRACPVSTLRTCESLFPSNIMIPCI